MTAPGVPPAGAVALRDRAGLPLALAAVGVWRPGEGLLMLAAFLHTLGGYAGGLGYAAVFGLLVIRRGARSGGVVAGSTTGIRRVVAGSITVLAACGQRSLSCYLGQSVLFAALLPAWTLGLGARLTVAEGSPAGRRGLARAAAGGRGVGPRRVPRPGGDPAAPAHLWSYRASGTRTRPSCTALTTSWPSRVKNRPVASPRAPAALGERHS